MGKSYSNEFAGIDEKLVGANENIRNLEIEISRFFQEGKYPILPEHDKEELLKAIEYHKNRVIPLRFSVLTGEAVHHLRSCLDHIAWTFSTIQYREENFRKIEFPVFEKRPVDKNSLARYEGKVKGIANPDVLNLIERLQPYNAADPINTVLFVIHNFDAIDKHRELVLSVPTGAREFGPDVQDFVAGYQRAHPEFTPVDLAIKLKPYGKLVPQISFKNFGRREIQPVIEGLMELFNETVMIVKGFAQYL
ncbi:MAG: hypothetical protein WCB53_17955 [Terriglobales bacterium]